MNQTADIVFPPDLVTKEQKDYILSRPIDQLKFESSLVGQKILKSIPQLKGDKEFWRDYQELLLFDEQGRARVRQLSFIISLLISLDKDVPLNPVLTMSIVRMHLENMDNLTEMQLFEFMMFVVANDSVVEMINSGKVHENLKSLLALQKYLVKQYASKIANDSKFTPKKLAASCQRLLRLMNTEDQPKLSFLLNKKKTKLLAAKYRDKEMAVIWQAINF